MKRFELSTLSLARRCSTTELHPQVGREDVSLATKKVCTTGVPSGNQASAFIKEPISRASKP